MDELKLIDNARHGDKDAFCGLYDRYKDRLYRYAFYRLRDPSDAEDAVSECVFSVWKQIGNLREPKAFPAWIFRILAACCSRIIRSQMARRSLSASSAADRAADAVADSDAPILLEEALGILSEDERNLVLLSVVGGLKSNEIAEITGLTAGSVRSSLSRSLKKMRGYLE